MHDLVRCAGKTGPTTAGALALFVLLVPLSTSAVFERSIFNVAYTHDQLRFRFFDADLSYAVVLSCVVFGMASALRLFSFLYSKRESAVLLSVGISRHVLFFNRFATGVLSLLIGIAVPFVASLALNVVSLNWYEGELHEFFYVCIGYFVCALISFSLSCAACQCAGTLFEAALFSFALIGCVSALSWGVGVLFVHLLLGNPLGALPYGLSDPVAPSLVEETAFFNPVLFFADLGAKHQSFQIMHPVYTPEFGSWLPAGIWFVISILVAVAGSFLLKARPGEQAQMAGMSVPFSFFSVSILSFFVFSLLVFVLAPVSVILGLIAGALAFCVLSCLLLRGPLRGRTKRGHSLTILGGEACVISLAVLIIATGGMGFSARVPDVSKIRMVELSYAGTPSYLARPFTGTASDAAYYLHTEYRFEDTRALETITRVHEDLIALGRAPLGTDPEDFSLTVIPYDMVFRYTLDDGSMLVRYFDRVRMTDLESLLVLDDTDEVRTAGRAVIVGDTSAFDEDVRGAIAEAQTSLAYATGDIYVADATYNVVTRLECSKTMRSELLRALAIDVGSQSATVRYGQPQQPLGTLMFTSAPQTDASSFGFSFSNAVVPLTPDFFSTLAWFEQNGLGELLSYETGGVDAGLIEEMVFVADDPFASIISHTGGIAPVPTSRFFMAYRSDMPGHFWAAPDFGSAPSVTDVTEIAEVSPHLKTACFMGGGYLVQAKLRGIDAWVYYYLPAGDAPSFLSGSSGMGGGVGSDGMDGTSGGVGPIGSGSRGGDGA